MTMRIILVPLFGSAGDAACLDAALGIAGRFGAHVTGLFVRIDPMDAIPVVGEGVSPAIIDQLTQAADEEMIRQRDAARRSFDAVCQKAGVAVVERPAGAGVASAGWLEITGRRDEVIPQKSRVSDLVVLSRPHDPSPIELRSVLEATLFGAGRAVLVVPPAGAPSVGHSVAIAWNGSAEAARAVAGALPLIEAAGAVHVLTAETWRTEFDVTVDLVEYLEWRGVTSERRVVAAEGGEPVGAALLRTATGAGADLLVMGGYGRTRLSELVLGGVTRHVLAHAELPILISH